MYAFECIKKVRKTSFPYFFSTNCDSSLEPHHMVMFAWYRWWDSNPHGFPPDFESGASANSATSAYITRLLIITNLFLKGKHFSLFFQCLSNFLNNFLILSRHIF